MTDTFDAGLLYKVPQHLIKAAGDISRWFEERNIKEWKLGGVQSRNIPREPEPDEHVVAVSIVHDGYKYRMGCQHSTREFFSADCTEWEAAGNEMILPRTELTFRDGVPIAYTGPDGVEKILHCQGGYCSYCGEHFNDIPKAHKHVAICDKNTYRIERDTARAEVVTANNRSERQSAEMGRQAGEILTARAEADQYRTKILAHNKLMDAVPSLGTAKPATASQGLRFLATWFDALYDDKPDDQVQRDLRRWADEWDAARDELEKREQAHLDTIARHHKTATDLAKREESWHEAEVDLATAQVEVDRMRGERTITCVYCGHKYAQQDETWNNDELTEHIKACPLHPMRKVEADLTAARAEVEQAQQSVFYAESERDSAWASSNATLEEINRLRREAQQIHSDYNWQHASATRYKNVLDKLGRLCQVKPAPTSEPIPGVTGLMPTQDHEAFKREVLDKIHTARAYASEGDTYDVDRLLDAAESILQPAQDGGGGEQINIVDIQFPADRTADIQAAIDADEPDDADVPVKEPAQRIEYVSIGAGGGSFSCSGCGITIEGVLKETCDGWPSNGYKIPPHYCSIYGQPDNADVPVGVEERSHGFNWRELYHAEHERADKYEQQLAALTALIERASRAGVRLEPSLGIDEWHIQTHGTLQWNGSEWGEAVRHYPTYAAALAALPAALDALEGGS